MALAQFSFQSAIFLCILFTTSSGSAKCRCRRSLLELPVECFEPSDNVCDDMDENAVDFTTFNDDVAKDLVAYYCCALREDDIAVLRKAVYHFQDVCSGDAFHQWQHSLEQGDHGSVSQAAIAKYCPNALTLSHFYTPTYTDLWKISRNSLPRHVMMSCDGAIPTTGAKVTVSLHGLGHDDLLPHAWLTFENGDKLSWQPAVNDLDNLNEDITSVTGTLGHFATEEDYDLPPDAIVWEVENVNLEALLKEKERIVGTEMFNLISHNCAHVTLRLLAAGLGCTHRIIPFFSPVGMVNVLKNIEQGSYWSN